MVRKFCFLFLLLLILGRSTGFKHRYLWAIAGMGLAGQSFTVTRKQAKKIDQIFKDSINEDIQKILDNKHQSHKLFETQGETKKLSSECSRLKDEISKYQQQIQSFNGDIELKNELIAKLQQSLDLYKNEVSRLSEYEQFEKVLLQKSEHLERKEKELALVTKELELDLKSDRLELNHSLRDTEYRLRELEKENLILLEQNNQLLAYAQNLGSSKPNESSLGEKLVTVLHSKDFDCFLIGSKFEGQKNIVDIGFKSTFSKTAISEIVDSLPALLPISDSPKFSIGHGKVRFIFDERDEIDKLKNDSNWYLKIAKNNHFRVNGQTGSGKSTFCNNLIKALETELGCKDVVLIDPKYPLSDWYIEAQYKGIEESIDGLQAVANEIDARLQQARDDRDNGLPIRRFEPKLFVVDELDWIYTDYKKDATNLLKVGLKVGRALNCKVAYIGQTPLCSLIGLNKPDFLNSTNIFLGENIKAGIEESCFDKGEKMNLLRELTIRRANNQKFLALVKEPSKPAYLQQLPTPSNNTY